MEKKHSIFRCFVFCRLYFNRCETGEIMTDTMENRRVRDNSNDMVKAIGAIIGVLATALMIWVGSSVNSMQVSVGQTSVKIENIQKSIESLQNKEDGFVTATQLTDKLIQRDKDIEDLKRRMLFIERLPDDGVDSQLKSGRK
jgi:hypothetical protein